MPHTVVYYLVAPSSDGGISVGSPQTGQFSDRESWLRFARSTFNSAGDVALDEDWFDNLSPEDQEAITS